MGRYVGAMSCYAVATCRFASTMGRYVRATCRYAVATCRYASAMGRYASAMGRYFSARERALVTRKLVASKPAPTASLRCSKNSAYILVSFLQGLLYRGLGTRRSEPRWETPAGYRRLRLDTGAKMKSAFRVLLPLLMLALIPSGAISQTYSGKNQRAKVDYGLMLAPSEHRDLAHMLLYRGHLDKAQAIVTANLRQFPGDYTLRGVAFKIAFLQERYADMLEVAVMPPDVLETYPMAPRVISEGWHHVGCLVIAELNGVKTGRDAKHLEAALMKEAWAKRESLPFGMVDEEGVHVDKQVLTLLLLQDSFGSHRKLLLERAANLAPNDTFILELKAKRLMDEGSAGGPVNLLDQGLAMYKKALKAKASEERIKYLKKEMAEAEKKVEWLKRVDEIRRRGGVTRV